MGSQADKNKAACTEFKYGLPGINEDHVAQKATCIWLVLQIIRSKFRINMTCTSHKSFTIMAGEQGT